MDRRQTTTERIAYYERLAQNSVDTADSSASTATANAVRPSSSIRKPSKHLPNRQDYKEKPQQNEKTKRITMTKALLRIVNGRTGQAYHVYRAPNTVRQSSSIRKTPKRLQKGSIDRETSMRDHQTPVDDYSNENWESHEQMTIASSKGEEAASSIKESSTAELVFQGPPTTMPANSVKLPESTEKIEIDTQWLQRWIAAHQEDVEATYSMTLGEVEQEYGRGLVEVMTDLVYPQERTRLPSDQLFLTAQVRSGMLPPPESFTEQLIERGITTIPIEFPEFAVGVSKETERPCYGCSLKFFSYPLLPHTTDACPINNSLESTAKQYRSFCQSCGYKGVDHKCKFSWRDCRWCKRSGTRRQHLEGAGYCIYRDSDVKGIIEQARRHHVAKCADAAREGRLQYSIPGDSRSSEPQLQYTGSRHYKGLEDSPQPLSLPKNYLTIIEMEASLRYVFWEAVHAYEWESQENQRCREAASETILVVKNKVTTKPAETQDDTSEKDETATSSSEIDATSGSKKTNGSPQVRDELELALEEARERKRRTHIWNEPHIPFLKALYQDPQAEKTRYEQKRAISPMKEPAKPVIQHHNPTLGKSE